jgi:hypothetical protein
MFSLSFATLAMREAWTGSLMKFIITRLLGLQRVKTFLRACLGTRYGEANVGIIIQKQYRKQRLNRKSQDNNLGFFYS